jgi:glutamate carboxypeptidase
MTASSPSEELVRAVDEAFEAAQVPWLRRVVDQPSHTHARDDVEAAAAIVDEVAASSGWCASLPDPGGKFADHRVYAHAGDRRGGPHGRAGRSHRHRVPAQLGFLAFERDGDAIRGPGVLDMKSGISEVLFALRALRRGAPQVYAACARGS